MEIYFHQYSLKSIKFSLFHGTGLPASGWHLGGANQLFLNSLPRINAAWPGRKLFGDPHLAPPGGDPFSPEVEPVLALQIRPGLPLWNR